MAGSLYVALTLRDFAVPDFSFVFNMFLAFMPVFILWLAIFYANSLYALDAGVYAISFAKSLIKSLSLALIVAVFFFYLSRGVQYAPKTILLYCIILLGILQICFRLPLMRLLAKRIKRRVIILADGPDTDSLVAFLRAREYGVYKLVAMMPPTAESLQQAIDLVKTEHIDDIVISNELQSEALPAEHLFDLLIQPVDFHYIADFYEQNLRKLPLSVINDFWVLESLGNSHGRRYDRIKRLIDIFFVFLLIPVILPLVSFVALLVRLAGDGPALFKQQRCGQYNKIFTIYKFRTMRIAANSGIPTVVNDDRVTSFGRLLRKTRLDELPQLWNVIRGDMSLIGPRPEQPGLAADLDLQVPFYRQRLLVRPGVSGWDQVSGEYHSPSVEDTYKKLQSDLYYIKNRSLFFDLQILLKTFMTIFSRSGV